MRRSVLIILGLVSLAACSADQNLLTPHVSQSATPQQSRIAELTAQLAWIGDMHHTAMQEAIHDSAFQTLTGRGMLSSKCAGQLAYMQRYLPLIESAAGAQPSSDAARAARVSASGLQVGVCRSSAG